MVSAAHADVSSSTLQWVHVLQAPRGTALTITPPRGRHAGVCVDVQEHAAEAGPPGARPRRRLPRVRPAALPRQTLCQLVQPCILHPLPCVTPAGGGWWRGLAVLYECANAKGLVVDMSIMAVCGNITVLHVQHHSDVNILSYGCRCKNVPIFCFETALKAFFWSTIIYDYTEGAHVLADCTVIWFRPCLPCTSAAMLHLSSTSSAPVCSSHAPMHLCPARCRTHVTSSCHLCMEPANAALLREQRRSACSLQVLMPPILYPRPTSASDLQRRATRSAASQRPCAPSWVTPPPPWPSLALRGATCFTIGSARRRCWWRGTTTKFCSASGAAAPRPTSSRMPKCAPLCVIMTLGLYSLRVAEHAHMLMSTSGHEV